MATMQMSEHHTKSRFLGVGYRAAATTVALVTIWVAATVAAVYSPDMITGSNHDHMQLAMFFVWPLAAIASGMVLLAAGVSRHDVEEAGPLAVYAIVTGLVWCGAALASVFVAPMSTGSDPTSIPIAALIAPLFAVLVTAYASIYVAGASGERVSPER